VISFEGSTHVFVLRIWSEPREIDGAQPQWRAALENVATKERRYLKDPAEIAVFLEPYAAGICPKEVPRSRVVRWLNRCRLVLKRMH
jgi:hypothetical protein